MTYYLAARPTAAGLDMETLEDAWLSLVTAAVSTTVGFGLREGYLLRWLVAWIMSWMIALPVLCAALPMIRRIIIRLEPDAYAPRS